MLLAACAVPTGLVALRAPDAETWRDDGSAASLAAAIEGSIAYYRRVPRQTRFGYGELSYAPEEMIASLELFRALRQQHPDPVAFQRALAERFLIFDSIAENGKNLLTGYFEPMIPGSHAPAGALSTPVYARPDNLVEVELSRFGESLPQRTLYGRVSEGKLLPYYSRSEIHQREPLEGARVLAYVNEVDLFFLQIQGSGLVRFDDGTVLRVNYAASNGHPYRSLGAELVRREALPVELVTMQSIRRYLADHPELVRALLFTNSSYTFFREVPEGPLGNIDVPLTPGRSIALDHRLFPKGSLAYIRTELPVGGAAGPLRPFERFMLVQDTGGAIRGNGRADIFWGQGPEAEWLAGHLKHPGRVYLLVARKEFLPPNAATAPLAAGDASAEPR
ncbi:MAG: MltA domain-containing protein [Candidatus Lambdaproteobacteria bacterium]|nr:MltA domain-containing protein [Candidatus Lambdaproteobacteria bacterium]